MLNSPERHFQSEQPDQQRQDQQDRGAGRRSYRRIKVLVAKIRIEPMFLTSFFSNIIPNAPGTWKLYGVVQSRSKFHCSRFTRIKRGKSKVSISTLSNQNIQYFPAEHDSGRNVNILGIFPLAFQITDEREKRGRRREEEEERNMSTHSCQDMLSIEYFLLLPQADCEHTFHVSGL